MIHQTHVRETRLHVPVLLILDTQPGISEALGLQHAHVDCDNNAAVHTAAWVRASLTFRTLSLS